MWKELKLDNIVLAVSSSCGRRALNAYIQSTETENCVSSYQLFILLCRCLAVFTASFCSREVGNNHHK